MNIEMTYPCVSPYGHVWEATEKQIITWLSSGTGERVSGVGTMLNEVKCIICGQLSMTRPMPTVMESHS